MNEFRSLRRAFLGALATLGLSGQFSHQDVLAGDAKPNPRELARKVEARYASCKTYRDTGLAKQILRDAQGQEQDMGRSKPRKITTAFVRPDRFRFEFADEHNGKPIRNLITMDGPAVKTWWDIRPGVQTPESLNFALGAAAGVTESSSTTIPTLLMPDLLKRPNALSAGPAQLSMLEDEAVGPHPCQRLRRQFESLNFQTKKPFVVVDTFWIDSQSLAIRRVVKEMRIDQGLFLGTLDLEPEFDAELPAEALAFDPPMAKP